MTEDFRKMLTGFVHEECMLVANQIGDAIAEYGRGSAAELRQHGETRLAETVEAFTNGAVVIAREFAKPRDEAEAKP